MNYRIIPRLEVKGATLVKGVHLEGLRVLGDPWSAARHYYEQGADEILYLDVVASLYQRNSILDLVQRTSAEVSVPLTVGGGLRSIEDIRRALEAGADKVSINTAAVRNPDLIRAAARRFGSSTIVVAIEAKRMPNETYEAYTDSGRERTGVEVIEWARRAEELGAGEILLTSIDREGTGTGFDLELTRGVARRVSIPVVASGGAGKASDIERVIRDGEADAVCLSSVLHYDFVEYTRPAGTGGGGRGVSGLRAGPPARIERSSLGALKRWLRNAGIPCRPACLEAKA